jgi:hypothetical protein
MQLRTAIFFAAILGATLPAPAQEQGYWRAASQTARSVTGDVALSPERLTMNFTGFTMVKIRPLTAAEVTSAMASDETATAPGSLYRLEIPGAKKFLHKNTLCSGEDVEWMAAYVSGRSLELAFFSGQTPPVLTPEAMANATDLCGTYSYVK